MELEHNFTVAVPVDRAWEVLLDLEQIAPCMPGAALTSYEGDTFTGTVRVKLGPVVMTFAGEGRFVERDEQTRRIVVEASGKDKRGGGTARATITAGLQPDGDATTVAVRSDLVVTGRVAQFGRGMIADVSTRLLGQFTDCLSGKIGAPAEAAAAAGTPAPAATPPAEPAGAADRTEEPGAGDRTEEPGAGDRTEEPGAAGRTEEPGVSEAPAATAPPAAGPTPARPRGSGPGQAPAPAREPVRAEPIDLLGVTGIRAATRRAVPYLLVFLVGAIAGGGLVALLVR